MQTALDMLASALDEHEQDFVAKIREHGWYRMSVPGDAEGPPLSYTTGFWVNAQQPELVTFGLKFEIVHNVFWDLFRDSKANIFLPQGTRTEQVFGNSAAYAFPVAKRFYRDHFGWSRWFYGGDEFPCLQIVWPDRDGVFPWEEGFDQRFAEDQVDLTEHGWLKSIVD